LSAVTDGPAPELAGPSAEPHTDLSNT
jgi:hypothetical protein